MSKLLGQILIETGIIQPDQLEQALKLQGPIPQPLGRLLVSQGLATEEQITAALAIQFGIPCVRLASVVVEPKILELVSRAMAEKYTICPLSLEEQTLLLVMADPLNRAAIQDVELRTFLRVQRAISTRAEVKDAIARSYATIRLSSDADKPS